MDTEVFGTKVLPLLTFTVLVMFFGSIIGFLATPILLNFTAFIILIVIEFIVLLALLFLFKQTFPVNLVLLLIFSLINGITLVPLFVWIIASTGGMTVIALALAITTFVFALLSLYVFVTRQNFNALGPILFIILIGVILASVAGFFLHAGNLFFIAIDVLTIILFMGFVLYDSSKILREYSNEDYVYATVSLYIDFVNLFIKILSLLARMLRRR